MYVFDAEEIGDEVMAVGHDTHIDQASQEGIDFISGCEVWKLVQSVVDATDL